MTHTIKKVIPADRYGLLVEFESAGLRVFQPRHYFQQQEPEGQYDFLALPPKFRHLIWDAHQVHWPAVTDREQIWGGHNIWPFELTLSADQLYELSEPFPDAQLKFVAYPVSMKNRAPTDQDARHHVFFVSLKPFSSQPFVIGESIGGGHGERGGSFVCSLAELYVRKNWRQHFEYSGCGWVVDLIENAVAMGTVQADLIQQLIDASGKR